MSRTIFDAPMIVPDVVAHRRDGQRDVEPPSILRHAHGLEVVDAFAAPQPRQDVVFLRLPLGRDQHAHGPSDQLVGRIAEQALGRGIARLNDAVEVLRDDGVVGGIDDRREVRLRGERLLLLGDVAKVADDAEASVRQGDAIQPPFVELGDAAIQAPLGALGGDVRLAGGEGVPEDARRVRPRSLVPRGCG